MFLNSLQLLVNLVSIFLKLRILIFIHYVIQLILSLFLKFI